VKASGALSKQLLWDPVADKQIEERLRPSVNTELLSRARMFFATHSNVRVLLPPGLSNKWHSELDLGKQAACVRMA